MPSPGKKSGSAEASLAARLAAIRLIILDVDGTLTDGTILYDAGGRELKSFHVHDGFGIVRASALGLHFAIATGRSSPAVTLRARELGIRDLYQNCRDKGALVERLRKKYRLTRSQICCMSDDVQDGEFLLAGGLRVAPSDADPEIRRLADIVTRRGGGRGAVREIIDRILRSQRLIPR
ncbi:MAG TPA: hypothetical protein VMW43_10465 [Bacteroidota bacterium]|nr:hypothetical protein [Bacteroidota bacterium]